MVEIERTDFMQHLADNILITGGTGSLGSCLTKELLEAGCRVTILSRNAHRQHQLYTELGNPKNLTMILGDVRDPCVVSEAMYRQDVLIHAAAQKRIERGETDRLEYLSINVLGTQNVLTAARNHRVQRCLLISTDKGCQPLNHYGLTKALAEKLWLAPQNYKNNQSFIALRYGNVIKSNGSVWHYWQDQLAHHKKLTVRTPEPTRFMVSLDQAANMVEEALQHAYTNSILVAGDLWAFSVHDLARQLEPDESNWDFQPLTSGEKQHEALVAPGEYAVQITDSLWRVVPGYEEYPEHLFHSNTCRRLTGAQVAQMLA